MRFHAGEDPGRGRFVAQSGGCWELGRGPWGQHFGFGRWSWPVRAAQGSVNLPTAQNRALRNGYNATSTSYLTDF